jgi:hypothetical protein
VIAVHGLALAAVLASVPRLARAGEEVRGAGPGERGFSLRRGLVSAAGGAFGAVTLVLFLFAGSGLLYLLRDQTWLAAGPRLGDALPLLVLAGHDGQPLALIAVAWGLAGLGFGVAVVRTRPLARAFAAAVIAALLVAFAADAADALARNLRLSDVLAHRIPGPGVWAEVVLFALGAWAPRRLAFAPRWRPRRKPAPVSQLAPRPG